MLLIVASIPPPPRVIHARMPKILASPRLLFCATSGWEKTALLSSPTISSQRDSTNELQHLSRDLFPLRVYTREDKITRIPVPRIT